MPVGHHDLADAGAYLPCYRLYYDQAHATPARWMARTQVWEQVHRRGTPAAPRVAMTLIYRDYHPQNTLWARAACPEWWTGPRHRTGPRELDLAHMRWNLVALLDLLLDIDDSPGPGDIDPADLHRSFTPARQLWSAPAVASTAGAWTGSA